MPLKKSKSNKNANKFYDPNLKLGYDLLNNLSQLTIGIALLQNKIFRNTGANLNSDSGEPITLPGARTEIETPKKPASFFGHIRQYANTLIDQAVSDDEGSLQDINDELNQLDAILNYKDILKLAESVNSEIQRLESNGQKYAADYVRKQNQGLFDKLDYYNEYFKTTGKSSNAVASLMYDKDKEDTLDRIHANTAYTTRHLTNQHFWDLWTGAGNLLDLGVGALEDLGVGLEQKVRNLFGAKSIDGQITRDAIKSLPTDDPLVLKLYRGNTYNDMNTLAFNQLMKNYRDNLERQKYEKLAELNEDLVTKDTGNMKLGLFIHAIPILGDVANKLPGVASMFGLSDYDTMNSYRFNNKNSVLNNSNNIWNPYNGTAGWKEAMDAQGSSILDMIKHPAVSLLQTASSVGMMKHSLNAMGADVLIGLIGGGIAGKAINLSMKSTMAYRTAEMAKAVKDAQTMAKAAKTAEQYSRASQALEGVNQALTGLNVGIGIGATVNARKQETNLEKMQAISERLYELAFKNGADMNKVISSIVNDANRRGIDTSRMTDLDLVNLGLALDTDTGDDVYENTKAAAKRGVNKLVNANNALALKDYMQLIPFTSYGGRALNDFAKYVANSGFVKGLARVSKDPVWIKYAPKYALKAWQTYNGVQPHVPVFSGIMDNAINKVAGRFFKKDFKNIADAASSILKGLSLKSVGKWLKPKASLVAFEATSEGIEEGQQEILQERYKLGLYDNYDRPYDMFNVGELFDNIDLAKESLSAYFGINNDPHLSNDQIRKAMNIGAVSALLQSGIMKQSGNITNDPTSFRALVGNLKADKTMAKLIGQHYQNIDDQNHLELFYNALHSGIGADKMLTALGQIRQNVDEDNSLVKRDYVDNDIRMLVNLSSLVNNKSRDKWLAEKKGYAKWSNDYKIAALQGAKRLTSYDIAVNNRNDAFNKLDALRINRESVANAIYRAIEDNDTEQIESLKNSNPKLFLFVLRTMDEYEQYSESAKKSLWKLSAPNNAMYDKGQDYWFGEATEEDIENEEKQQELKYIPTKLDYVIQNVKMLNMMHQLNLVDKLYQTSQNRKEFLDGFRKFTGLDLDTTMLGEITDVLKEELNRLKEILKNTFPANKKNGVNITYKDYFGEHADDTIDDTDQYLTLAREYYLNDATAVPLNKLAQPYRMLLGGKYSANPIQIRQAIYGDNYEGETPLNSDIKQYKELLRKKKGISDPNEEYVDSITLQHDIDKISEKTALDQIERDVKDEKHRMYIANREWIEETPITPSDVDDAENGDKDAQEKVNRATESSEADTRQAKPTEADLETEDERRLAEQVSGRPKNESKKKKKISENIAAKYAELLLNTREDTQPEDDDLGETKEEQALTEAASADDTTGDEPTLDEENDDNLPPIPPTSTSVPAGSDEVPLQTTTSTEEPKAGTEEGNPVTKTEPEKPKEGDKPEEKGHETPDEPINEGDPENEVKDEPTDDELDEDEPTDDENQLANEDADAAAVDSVFENQLANLESDQWRDDIDPTKLDYDEDSERYTYDGEELSLSQSDAIKQDLDDNNTPDDSSKSNATWNTVGNIISNTFFYSIDPSEWDKPMSLKVHGEDVFDKPLNTAHQLSERLLQKGWLRKANKYYIVTQSLEAEENPSKSDIQNGNWDNLTVVMIIESGNERYAVALRKLGTTLNTVKDEKTGKEKTYRNSGKMNLIYSLTIRNINLYKVSEVLNETVTPSSQSKNDVKHVYKKVHEAIDKLSKERGIAYAVGQFGMPEDLAEKWWKDGVNSEDESTRKRIQKYTKSEQAWKSAHARIDLSVRKSLAITGKKVMTDDQINALINKLQDFRNSIIKAYLVAKKRKNTKTNRTTTIYDFPSTVKDNVKPKVVQLSNGIIDSMRDLDGNPVYRKVTSDSQSIDDIDKEIEDGTLLFGYGHGAFGEKDENGMAFQITGVREKDATTLYPGVGRSGKIYWMVEGPSESGTRTPVMLHEQLFDYQEDSNGNKHYLYDKSKLNDPERKDSTSLHLCLEWDPVSRKMIRTNNDYIPSAAEILMYMICHRFDFGTNDAEAMDQIVQFFIHTGDQTLLENQTKVGSDPLNFLANKQISYTEDEDHHPVLKIAIGDKTNGFHIETFTMDDLFGNTPEAEDNRKQVVYAIATQMHWDTDLTHMRDRINLNDKNNAVSTFIAHLIAMDESLDTSNMTVDEVLNHRVKILGNDQLSFRIGDFYQKDDDGNINCKDGNVSGKEDVGVFAWMIANLKLETDASKKVFKLPFVYGYGVEGETAQDTPGMDANNAIEEAKTKEGGVSTAPSKPNKSTKPVFSILDSGQLNEFKPSYEKASRRELSEKLQIPTTEEQRLKYLEDINNSRSVKRRIEKEGEGATIVDRVFMRYTYMNDKLRKIDNIPDFMEQVEKLTNQFIDKYNKQFPDRKASHITVDAGLATTMYNALDTGYAYLDIQKDGTAKLHFNNGKTRSSWGVMSGIYSTHKSKGVFDRQQALDWLLQKLGLSEHNVIVRHGIIRSVDNKNVYGLTNVALDRIAQLFEGYIALSRDSGSGITYHEAWHYVNLLINDALTRKRIYDDYLNSHKKFKQSVIEQNGKITSHDIEEALADAFMNYVQGLLDTSLSGRIKRLFSNVLDFVLISRRKSSYRQLFKAVLSGKFAKRKIDQRSALEFKQAYKKGAPKIAESIPGYDKDLVDYMDSMDTHDDLFRALGAVVRRVMSDFNIDSIERMKMLSGKYEGRAGITFKNVLDKVDEMIDDDSIDQLFSDMLEDLKDNPELIRHALGLEFAKLGVRVKWEHGKNNTKKDESTGETISVDDEVEKNEAKRRENADAFQFDQMHLTVSKKENAALNTKIFFWSIPILTLKDVFSDSETQEYVQETDEFGTPLFYDFDKSWTKILSDLWMCTSLDDVYTEDIVSKTTNKVIHKAGDYKTTSIFGRVLQLAKADRFYQSVFEKLKSISTGRELNPQLRSQLFSTINSYKSLIAKVVIQDPKYYYSPSDFEDGAYEDYSSDDIDQSIGEMMRTALVNDISRRWQIQDDSLIAVERALPRRWSKQIASLGLIEYDKKGGSVVSEKFVRKYFAGQGKLSVLEKLVSELNSITEKDKKTKQYSTSYDKAQEKLFGVGTTRGLKEQVSDFLNAVGINMDVVSLDLFVHSEMSRGDYGDGVRGQAEVLKKLLTDTNKRSGGFGAIKLQLVDNIGNTEFPNNNHPEYTRSLDLLYNNYQSTSWLSRLATAYNAIHPSSSEFSSKGPNGEIYYPINLNNYITDRITLLNDHSSTLAKDLSRDPYAKHSGILSIALSKENATHRNNIRAEVFVGMQDSDRQKGNDYFGITPMEDYLSKIFMTENDMLVIPTMADKKTWYALVSDLFKKFGIFSHELLINQPNVKTLNKVIYKEYNKLNPIDNFDKLLAEDELTDDYRDEARKWFRGMSTNDPQYRAIVSEATLNLINEGNVGTSFYIQKDKDGYIKPVPRFSETVLNRFGGYFLDEIDSLIAYYDEDNIKALVKDPNRLLENFHGSVDTKTGRMDFSGNGGKFRYFYDLGITAPSSINFYLKINGKRYKVTNLNLILQSLWLLQQRIESDKSNDAVKVKDDTGIYNNIGIDSLYALRKKEGDELDGFELVRQYLLSLRKSVVSERMGLEIYSDNVLDAINDKLQTLTRLELETLSHDGPLHLVQHENATGLYTNYGIPEQLLLKYIKQLKDAGFVSELNQTTTPIVVYSLIANSVANSAISTIEFEKVFSGDPALYKENSVKIKKDKDGKVISGADKIFISGKIGDKSISDTYVYAEKFGDISSDKIKRLGSLLSPGLNIRTYFNSEELKLYGLHNVDTYSVLDIEDLNAPSLFLDQIKSIFSVQLLVDYINNSSPESFDDFVEQISKESYEYKKLKDETVKYRKLDKRDIINMMYSNKDIYNRYYDTLPNEVKNRLQNTLKAQIGPYEKITVSDAQVFIRPDTYRRIRIGLGEWSFKADETGYSDEDAYNIIENGYYIKNGQRVEVGDGTWMTDMNLAKKVAKFQTYPLKMSYFLNDSEKQNGRYYRNHTTLNKMAIFAVFKFHRSTDVGKLIYDRMNAKGNEIDMIAFKSAVKVGAVKDGAQPVDKKASVDKITAALSEQLKVDDNGNPLHPNDRSIDYTTGEQKHNVADGNLAISILNLHNLRMLLNTKAHELDERNIGTQMFKIAFSNVQDDVSYGMGIEGRRVRTGSEIKHEIMDSVNLLTTIGAQEVRDRFNFGKGVPNRDAILQWLASICISNGLGTVANQIITQGGSASSLMSRTVFENSASAYVNDEVVGIETLGGTAIQLSMFGFAAYDKNSVHTQITQGGVNNYTLYNNGEELKWNAKDGSMLVLLSANFFRTIVPSEYRGSYKDMRDWLLKNNIIGSKSKAFGIGYRIPTQGQSSMFVMQVADILPQLAADTIIVPREFTAQTGSDFDVDKLFLATKTYVNGHELTVDDETFNEMAKNNHNNKERSKLYDLYKQAADNWYKETGVDGGYNINRAIGNRLLSNYIDILSDTKTYAAAHASIDVITELIKDLIVKPIRGESDVYTQGMSTLTPSFQASRKMEFSVGKAGIAPFALNITNLSLTLYAHLSLDFGKNNPFKLKPLDSIYSEDGSRIADWLSAMVNAHVDVAKDPYIFVLNVNQATYNMANFLLRTGKGLGTFTFLALPILKDFANIINSSGGIYGGNLKGDITNESEIGRIRKRLVIKRLIKNYVSRINRWLEYDEQLPDSSSQKLSKQDRERYLNTVKYFNAVAERNLDEVRKESDVKDPYDDLSQLIDYSHGILSIQDSKEENKQQTDVDVKKLLESYTFQLASLRAFSTLSTNADRLAALVRASLIDTEKFGNSIAKQINWQNRFELFKYTSSGWTLNKNNFDKYVQQRKNDIKTRLQNQGKDTGIVDQSNFDSIIALNRYFGNSYLDYKFYTARAYTRSLLSGQTFTATKEFSAIFKYIMGSKFGFTEWTDLNGDVHKGYGANSGASEDIAQKVSNAIDNVMRATAFMRLGYKTYKDLKEDNPDMIDFTEGNRPDLVRARLLNLMYGDNTRPDIFTRVRQLINDIKHSKDSKYDVLKDPVTGDVSNELLNYLNPVSKFGEEPVGKMALAHMQSLTSDEEKVRLSSAFSLLFNSTDDDIRQLAEDLAFYAYYSQYDQNTPNSFFDIVPIEVRKQYDETLNRAAKALDDYRNDDTRKQTLLDILGNDQYNLQTPLGTVESSYADMILDIVSKNYWFDENIVSTYYTKTQTATFDSYGGDMFGDLVFNENGKLFPQFLMTTSIRNNPKYINIKSGGEKMLYQRVGLVTRVEKPTDDSDGGKSASSFYIYIPVQKLGYHSRNISQFEFAIDEVYGSLFDANKIAGEYKETLVRRDVEKMVKEYGSKKYDLGVVWDTPNVPVSRTEDSAAYLPITQGVDRTDRKVIGTTVYQSSANPDKTGESAADVIVDFLTGKEYKGKDYAQDDEKLSKKTVLVKFGHDASEYIDKILSFKGDNSILIHFTTPHYDYELESKDIISKKEIDQYVLSELNDLEAQYRSDEEIDNSKIPELLERDKEDVEKRARRVIAQEKINKFMSQLTYALLNNGVKIKRFTASSRKSQSGSLKTDLAKGVRLIKRAYPGYFDKNNIIYVQNKLYQDPKARNRYLYVVENAAEEGIGDINYTPVEVAENTDNTINQADQKINNNETEAMDLASQLLSGRQDTNEQDEAYNDPSIIDELDEDKKDESSNQDCK